MFFLPDLRPIAGVPLPMFLPQNSPPLLLGGDADDGVPAEKDRAELLLEVQLRLGRLLARLVIDLLHDFCGAGLVLLGVVEDGVDVDVERYQGADDLDRKSTR